MVLEIIIYSIKQVTKLDGGDNRSTVNMVKVGNPPHKRMLTALPPPNPNINNLLKGNSPNIQTQTQIDSMCRPLPPHLSLVTPTHSFTRMEISKSVTNKNNHNAFPLPTRSHKTNTHANRPSHSPQPFKID